MSLEKQTLVDRIEILESGVVQVRTTVKIYENGDLISQTYHRHLVKPGDNYNSENERVKSVCAAVHSEEVIAAFNASE